MVEYDDEANGQDFGPVREDLESDDPKSELVWVIRWTGAYGGADLVYRLDNKYYYLADDELPKTPALSRA